MALSKLTSLTQAQYQALTITPFRVSPVKTPSGSPDTDVQITLGGWVGTDVIAFYINDNPGTMASLNLDTTDTNAIDVIVLTSTNKDPVVTYWTINLGSNAINSDWTISFDVAAGGTKTGVWVFKKGKITGDEY